MRQFTLPDLGEGLEEAEIVSWFVNEGDNVVADQPLVSVETDKAVVEVPSPWSGRIGRLFGGKGDVVKVGAPLVEFAEGAEEDRGTVVGEIGGGVGGAAARHGAAAEAPASGPARAPLVQVLPAVRALARKLDVDLNEVQATGAGGTVTRADVERAARGTVEAGPAEPLRGMRRAMAQRMTIANAEVVRTTVTEEADIGDWPKGEDITIRLVRAIAAACGAEPALNVWYNATAAERRLMSRIDIGIAVDTEDGLIVPVLRNVAEREAGDLRAGLRPAARRCRRALDTAGGTPRRHHHAVEFRHDRRPLCEPRRRAAAGGDRRSGPCRPARRRASRRDRGAAGAADLADLRPPRGDRRRGRPVSRCAQVRSRRRNARGADATAGGALRSSRRARQARVRHKRAPGQTCARGAGMRPPGCPARCIRRPINILWAGAPPISRG